MLIPSFACQKGVARSYRRAAPSSETLHRLTMFNIQCLLASCFGRTSRPAGNGRPTIDRLHASAAHCRAVAAAEAEQHGGVRRAKRENSHAAGESLGSAGF